MTAVLFADIRFFDLYRRISIIWTLAGVKLGRKGSNLKPLLFLGDRGVESLLSFLVCQYDSNWPGWVYYEV